VHSALVQVALFEALEAVPGVWPVYDSMPDETALPYVEIGDSSEENIGSKSSPLYHHVVEVNLWADDDAGRMPVKEKAADIIAALVDTAPQIAGAIAHDFEYDGLEVIREETAGFVLAVLRLSIRTERE
jgi:hypothetical protein